jgi:hypothetical protein
MGEQHMYEEMQRELELASLSEAAAEDEKRIEAEMASMRGYAAMPKNGWQRGCPFLIKDVVYHTDSKMQGITSVWSAEL